MKHVIIEGGDRLGKSTLIEGISRHFNYDNVSIRHFGKPPKVFPEGFTPLSFQMECFFKEGHLLNRISQMENDEFCYYENIVIWNRAHLGEYVYGQMFRGADPKQITNALKNFEERFLIQNEETVLILLTAEPEFFLSKEDGQSFSQDLKDKTAELKLFDEAFEASTLDNKMRLKVDDGGEFLPKEYILETVLEFMKHKDTLL